MTLIINHGRFKGLHNALCPTGHVWRSDTIPLLLEEAERIRNSWVEGVGEQKFQLSFDYVGVVTLASKYCQTHPATSRSEFVGRALSHLSYFLETLYSNAADSIQEQTLMHLRAAKKVVEQLRG